MHAGFGYFQREAGYTRTGSHNTRVHGRETGQWHEADLAVAQVPASLLRTDGRSVYQRHGGIRYATRAQLAMEERTVAQARADSAPHLTRAQAAHALGADPARVEAALAGRVHHTYDDRARGPIPITPGTLLVIDEASMLSAPDLADLIAYAQARGAKVIPAGEVPGSDGMPRSRLTYRGSHGESLYPQGRTRHAPRSRRAT